MVGKRKRAKAASIVDDTREPHMLNERGKEILAMITALEDEDRLSSWEKGFVESISDSFLGKERDLTPLQYEKLKTIYRKFN